MITQNRDFYLKIIEHFGFLGMEIKKGARINMLLFLK